MKVAPSPTFPRGIPPPNLDFLSIYPTLRVTNAFLGLNSSLMALLSYYCGFSEFQIQLGKN